MVATLGFAAWVMVLLPHVLVCAAPEEIQEMRRVVEEGLAHVSFPGWRVEVVGGAARGKSSHDGGIEHLENR